MFHVSTMLPYTPNNQQQVGGLGWSWAWSGASGEPRKGLWGWQYLSFDLSSVDLQQPSQLVTLLKDKYPGAGGGATGGSALLE